MTQQVEHGEPMTPPTPRHRLGEFAFFLGNWRALGIFHETPFGPRKPIEMRVVGTSEHRGFWINIASRELPTPENPTPLDARWVWGYDAAANEFVADWFDSNGGRARQRSTGWNGNRLVFLGEMTLNGRSVPLRDTFTRKGEGRYHHIGEIDLAR